MTHSRGIVTLVLQCNTISPHFGIKPRVYREEEKCSVVVLKKSINFSLVMKMTGTSIYLPVCSVTN
jgi:hypothetical protein